MSKETLSVYIFINIMGNYCDGEYYFVASSLAEAIKIANAYSNEHNTKIKNDSQYTIEWETEEEIETYPIKPGFLSLNRTNISVLK